tara:strand:- start:2790 stop:3038 length:249 start_codon:yes stop_codon:yes gene_type:complete
MRILHDRILVEPTVKETVKSGLILPESSKDNNTGKVVLVGEKVKVIKVGDTVKFHQNAGIGISYHEKKCLFMSEEHEIIAVL